MNDELGQTTFLETAGEASRCYFQREGEIVKVQWVNTEWVGLGVVPID